MTSRLLEAVVANIRQSAPQLPKRTWSSRNDSFASCAGVSHGLPAMALGLFLSRLTKCAESQDLRPELDGEDLRPAPLKERKGKLEKLLARGDGIRFSEHIEGAPAWRWS